MILVEEKKKSDSEFLSYNLMLNSGKKICETPLNTTISVVYVFIYVKLNYDNIEFPT
jgi:hypothetical protein